MYRHAVSKKKGRSRFAEFVRDVVRNIPKGRVLSYGEVARQAGFPGAARAVGTVMRNNADPNIPCHRVIRADGIIGAYNRGGASQKGRILAKEGVNIHNGKVIK